MEWLTESLEIVIPVAIVLLYMFQHFFTRHRGDEQAGPPEAEDTEARRIQEEIRRKIIERQQGRTSTTTEESQAQRQTAYSRDARRSGQQPPAFPRQQTPPPVPRERREPPPRVAYVENSRTRDIESELREQRERLRESQIARDQALAKTRGRVEGNEARWRIRREKTGALHVQLKEDLATTANLRRAFVLKEVLDRPVSLRPDSGFNYEG